MKGRPYGFCVKCLSLTHVTIVDELFVCNQCKHKGTRVEFTTGFGYIVLSTSKFVDDDTENWNWQDDFLTDEDRERRAILEGWLGLVPRQFAIVLTQKGITAPENYDEAIKTISRVTHLLMLSERKKSSDNTEE